MKKDKIKEIFLCFDHYFIKYYNRLIATLLIILIFLSFGLYYQIVLRPSYLSYATSCIKGFDENPNLNFQILGTYDRSSDEVYLTDGDNGILLNKQYLDYNSDDDIKEDFIKYRRYRESKNITEEDLITLQHELCHRNQEGHYCYQVLGKYLDEVKCYTDSDIIYAIRLKLGVI